MGFTSSRVFFLAVAEAAPKPEHRREAYAHARAFFLWAGDAPPEALTRADFTRYRRHLEAEGVPKVEIWFTLEDVFRCLQAYAKHRPGYRPPYSDWVQWAYGKKDEPTPPNPPEAPPPPRGMKPDPDRNYRCRFYAQCLSRAAHAGRGGGPLSCRDCGQCQAMTDEEWRGALFRDIYPAARLVSATFAEELGTNRPHVLSGKRKNATKEGRHDQAQ